MLATFTTVILYGQLVVSAVGVAPPPELWRAEEESEQGFSWEPGTVAFGVPDVDGECEVAVDTDAKPFQLAPDALWAVSVPFTASSPAVEIGTVLLEQPFAIRPGAYQLVFEALPGRPGHPLLLRLDFVRGGPSDYAILKQGSLGSATVLRRRSSAP